ncbi:DUF2071 domain-containing protein [Aquimarina sp. 2201CG5-10]|uniref:YqjF family protein n=1 Tax=Aquimarina callyspongiae TaxID=3098150 RepID=UPI002AB3B832|nr:DUF2071 domain-containing protein [Aquimarina sp. 2201CG5-10]MDY8137659.1 DUF2071 domain-containing protein [Aquimarina sp. 2201CG5-10]
MKTKEILHTTKHRPWEIPDKPWKFYQEWNNAIFLHWEVDYDILRKQVPKELEIDLFEQKPWVSAVVFAMEKIRPKNLPSFPPVSNFNETNIRTYVRFKGKPGVYFLSIEADKRISCAIAKGISELPYRFSEMKREKSSFTSRNQKFKDQLNFEYILGKKVTNKTATDKWLTERYALFQDTRSSINQFEIHHIEWPIQEVKISKLNINYPRFSDLIHSTPDIINYSPGIQVIAWGKNKVKK